LSATQQTASSAQSGDVVVVAGHRVGEAERTGTILEVLGEPGHEHFRVRWEDGRETVFYPGSDATIRRSRSRPSRKEVRR
jgi:hypothetical protein